eukprot:403370336
MDKQGVKVKSIINSQKVGIELVKHNPSPSMSKLNQVKISGMDLWDTKRADKNIDYSQCKMKIETDKKFYYGNETVEGKVYIKLNQSVEVNYLSIEMKSYEQIYKTRTFKGKKRREPVKQNLLHIKEVLPKISKSELFADDYEFSFTFRIPNDIPASFMYAHKLKPQIPLFQVKHRFKCAIVDYEDYEVIATKLPLLIRYKPQMNDVFFNKAVTEKIKSKAFCCPTLFNNGTTTISIQTDKEQTTQLFQDKLNLEVQVDNSKSSVPIQEFRVQYLTLIQIFDNDGKQIKRIKQKGDKLIINKFPNHNTTNLHNLKIQLPLSIQDRLLYNNRSRFAIDSRLDIFDKAIFLSSQNYCGLTSTQHIQSQTFVELQVIYKSSSSWFTNKNSSNLSFYKKNRLIMPVYSGQIVPEAAFEEYQSQFMDQETRKSPVKHQSLGHVILDSANDKSKFISIGSSFETTDISRVTTVSSKLDSSTQKKLIQQL